MTGGAGTELDTKSVSFESNKLLEAILPQAVVRRIFPIFTVLPVHKQNYTFWELLNDIGTKYDFDPYEYGRNANALKETSIPVPLIYHEATYDKFKLRRINESKAPLVDRIRQMAKVFRTDEDIIGIAGESTKTGVTSISNTGTNSTAAGSELDLGSIDDMYATFNGIINQLNNLLNANSGNQTVKNFPCIAVMTSNVEDRLWVLKSALDDTKSMYMLFKEILTERCGPGSEIIVSNALGGTVTTVDQRVKLSTPGTANFALMAKGPEHYGIVASEIFRDEETNISGFTQEFAERWRPIFFRKESIIFSGTVALS